MRDISHGEGRVTVKTYKDRNGGWGHFNKQMYDADDKGWSLTTRAGLWNRQNGGELTYMA